MSTQRARPRISILLAVAFAALYAGCGYCDETPGMPEEDERTYCDGDTLVTERERSNRCEELSNSTTRTRCDGACVDAYYASFCAESSAPVPECGGDHPPSTTRLVCDGKTLIKCRGGFRIETVEHCAGDCVAPPDMEPQCTPLETHPACVGVIDRQAAVLASESPTLPSACVGGSIWAECWDGYALAEHTCRSRATSADRTEPNRAEWSLGECVDVPPTAGAPDTLCAVPTAPADACPDPVAVGPLPCPSGTGTYQCEYGIVTDWSACAEP